MGHPTPPPPEVSRAHSRGRSIPLPVWKQQGWQPDLPWAQSTCAAELHTRVHVCTPGWNGWTLTPSPPPGAPPLCCVGVVLQQGGPPRHTPPGSTVHNGRTPRCPPQPRGSRGGEPCPPPPPPPCPAGCARCRCPVRGDVTAAAPLHHPQGGGRRAGAKAGGGGCPGPGDFGTATKSAGAAAGPGVPLPGGGTGTGRGPGSGPGTAAPTPTGQELRPPAAKGRWGGREKRVRRKRPPQGDRDPPPPGIPP